MLLNKTAPHIISHHGRHTHTHTCTLADTIVTYMGSVSNYKRQAKMIKAKKTMPKYMMKKRVEGKEYPRGRGTHKRTCCVEWLWPCIGTFRFEILCKTIK